MPGSTFCQRIDIIRKQNTAYPAPKGTQYQFRSIEFQDLGAGVDDQSERSKQPDSQSNEDHNELLLGRVSRHRLLRGLPISILVQALTLGLSWPSNVLGEFPDHWNRRGDNEGRRRIGAELEKIPHRDDCQ